MKRIFLFIILLIVYVSCSGKKTDTVSTAPASEPRSDVAEGFEVRNNDGNAITPAETGMENMNSYGIDDENFEELLGQWYGLENSLYDFDETGEYFTITKSGDLYSIEFTISSRCFKPYSLSSAGIIKREEVIAANRKYFSDYKMLTDDGDYFFRIKYNYDKLFGKKIVSCHFSDPSSIEPWVFIKKDELIRIGIPDLNLPKKLQGPLLIGFINDGGVRIRENYGLTGKTLRTLKKGEQVNITGVSPEFEVIDGNYQHWYRVTTDDGITGWVYGLYLGITGFLLDGEGEDG